MLTSSSHGPPTFVNKFNAQLRENMRSPVSRFHPAQDLPSSGVIHAAKKAKSCGRPELGSPTVKRGKSATLAVMPRSLLFAIDLNKHQLPRYNVFASNQTSKKPISPVEMSFSELVLKAASLCRERPFVLQSKRPQQSHFHISGAGSSFADSNISHGEDAEDGQSDDHFPQ